MSRALDSLGRDEEYLSELAGIFLAAAPTLLKNLTESIAAKNLSSAADAAHLLWSGARTLSAPGVAKAALAVEMVAHRNELDDIGGAYHALQLKTEQLLDSLTDFRNRRDASPRMPQPPSP
jgi:HPt (histidine-containing phosphotransfer) domain-containing protein